MVDATIIASVRNYLFELAGEGFPVSFGVLFGSYVKGTAHEWSDIDLIVVSPLYDEQKNLANILKLWRLRARTDSRIEPIACGARQWREDDGTPIIEVARQEGVIVYPEAEGEDVRQTG